MFESKFNPGEEVYIISDFKINKGLVEEVICKKTIDKTAIEYNVSLIGLEKKTVRAFPEAFLVKDFATAKFSAMTNWNNIVKKVDTSFNALTEKDFEPKVVNE